MRIRSMVVMGVLAAAGAGAGLMGVCGSPALAGNLSQAAGAFTVDSVHSSVVFKAQRVNGAPFYGTFRKIEGSFTIDAANPSASVIDVTIPVESIDSNNPGRDKHLKNSDFFSAAEHPTLTFKSKSFTKKSDTEWEVAGELTARGVTKPVTIKAIQTGTGPARGGGTMVGLDVTFTIKRSEFGINYGPQALADEVAIMVGLEGVKK